jgi:DNA primase
MYDLDTEKKHAELIGLLEEFLGDPRKHYTTKGQVSFDCPNCSAMKGVDYDGKGNLEVNYDMGVYNCWSCAETHGTKGKIYNLFKNFADRDLLRRFVGGKFNFTGDFYTNQEFVPKKELLKLPEEYYTLAGKQNYRDFKPAFNYLYSRGINDETIEKYQIGFCLIGKYQNRVIVPSFDKNGDLNYFVTRSISKYTKKYKYLNPDVDKTSIIFNEKLINWEKPIFLVEGVFDHIVIPNSIPLLGKKLYDKLFSEIYFNSKNFIIIVLDPDAYDDSVKIFNTLNAGRLRKKIYLNIMPKDHDVSSFNQTYGYDELKKWLKEKNYKLND